MDCLFKDVSFGEKVSLGDGYSTCMNCAADTQKIMESIQWIYCGHSADFDLFQPEKPIKCPSCGTNIVGYMQRCGEPGGLEVQAGSIFHLQESHETQQRTAP